jgi:hypothetical protein
MSENGVLRRIEWQECCPWLVIFRSFRLAISPPLLLLATLGTLLTPVGWYFAAVLFLEDPAASMGTVAVFDDRAFELAEAPATPFTTRWGLVGQAVNRNVVGVYWFFVRPFREICYPSVVPANLPYYAYYLVGGLWNILVWSFFAGTITRVAVVQFGREERISAWEAMVHVAKRFGWYLLAPFFPFLGIVLTAFPIALLGLLMRLDVGVLVAGVVWPLVLLGGLIIVAVLLGLMFGWPLMWPTISAEHRGDAFEAFSRSYSYTFQRPLQYVFYALLTVVFGSLCWLLVNGVSTAVVEASYRAAAWGAGDERIHEVMAGDFEGVLPGVGGVLIQMGASLVSVIAIAFSHGFFWCAASAIYLLLRRDVDQTEFDEVFVEDEETRYGLPPLESDKAGVPGVDEKIPKGE